MKTVLIIGADFVPSSLPPAMRIRFFANHLPEFGWHPIILTTDPRHYESPTDVENQNLLSPSLKVIRTKALSVRWTRKFGVGDVGMRSLWYHWQALKRICNEQQIDLIFIPVPPYLSMVLGRLAHHKFGIPYVIDYIDPWLTEYYWGLPKEQRPPKWPLAYAMAKVSEPFALRRVAHITGVSQGTTDSVVVRHPWLSATDATEIPYGGEGDDFVYLRRYPKENPIFRRDDGLLHMSCVGACIPAMHATVRALFSAVKLGLRRSPDLFSRLRLHFVGTSYAADGSGPRSVAALAREADIDMNVDEHPARVTYLQSLQLMLDSHALFLVGSDEPHYTASKVFPYILARRPLLAIFHEQSSVVQILRETGAGETVTFKSKEEPAAAEISAQLERLLMAPRDYHPATRADAFDHYTTRAMAERLADVFGRVRRSKHELQKLANPYIL